MNWLAFVSCILILLAVGVALSPSKKEEWEHHARFSILLVLMAIWVELVSLGL